MSRLLSVSCDKNVIQCDKDYVEVCSGSGSLSITIPCKGTVDSDGKVKPYEIFVEVDEQTYNNSFHIETYNPWFKYWTERIIDGDKSYSVIYIQAKENLDTQSRYGTLTIYHNVIPISIILDITQLPTVYTLDAQYKTDGIFNSFPTKDKDSVQYEEKEVVVTTQGGSRKWFIKDIMQYIAYNGVDGEATKSLQYMPTENRGTDNEIKVSYDGAFKYLIQGDKLTVRSFGKVDLLASDRHMRYYFRICHKDINNINRQYNNTDADKDYQRDILFIFDNNSSTSYGDDTPDDNSQPTVVNTYVFKVNGKESDSTKYVDNDDQEITVSVVSLLNGSECTYTHSSDNSSITTTDGKTISIKKQEDIKNGVITYKQDGSKKTIKLTIIPYAKSTGYVFTVDGKDSSFEYYQSISSEGGKVTPTKKDRLEVVSTYNNINVAYGVSANCQWARWTEDTEGNKYIEFDKNATYSTDSRTVKFMFKQGGGSTKEPIYVTFKQEAAENPTYTVTIHFYINGTTDKIKDDVVITGKQYKETVSYTADSNIQNGGYNYSLYSDATKSIVVLEDCEIIFYYEKNVGQYTYKIYHKDNADKTTNLINPITYSATYGTTVKVAEKKKNIDGYKFVGSDSDFTVTDYNMSANCYYEFDVAYEFYFTKEKEQTTMTESINSEQTTYTCDVTSNKLVGGTAESVAFEVTDKSNNITKAEINGSSLVLSFDANIALYNKLYTVELTQSESGKKLNLTLTHLSKDVFLADYLTLKYTWKNGTDLDTATVLRLPNVGKSDKISKSNAVGYSLSQKVSYNNKDFLIYGGDNKKSGDEGALICFKELKDYIDSLDDKETWCKNNLGNDNDDNGYYVLVDVYSNWFEKYSNEDVGITLISNTGATSYNQSGFTFSFNGGITTTQAEKTIRVNASCPLNVRDFDNGYSKTAIIKYYIQSGTVKMITNTNSSEWSYEDKDKIGAKVDEITINGYTCVYLPQPQTLDNGTDYYYNATNGSFIPQDGGIVETKVNIKVNSKLLNFATDLELTKTPFENTASDHIKIVFPKTNAITSSGLVNFEHIALQPIKYDWIKIYLGNMGYGTGFHQECTKDGHNQLNSNNLNAYIFVDTNKVVHFYKGVGSSYRVDEQFDIYVNDKGGDVFVCDVATVDGGDDILSQTQYLNVNKTGTPLKFKNNITNSTSNWKKYSLSYISSTQKIDSFENIVQAYVDFENSLKIKYNNKILYNTYDFCDTTKNIETITLYPDYIFTYISSDGLNIDLVFTNDITYECTDTENVSLVYDSSVYKLTININANNEQVMKYYNITITSKINECQITMRFEQKPK